MKFGVILPNYGLYARADSIISSALKSEELGYDSVWATDHVIVPSKFRDDYGITYEALSTLAFLSGITTRIKLGSSIIVVPMRNPVYLAKQIATVDSYSKGRLIIGAASGYMEEEFSALGANFKKRGKFFDESLRIMRSIWKSDLSSYEGEFFRFQNMISYPKPFNAGGPPIWIGGESPAALERVALLGDGWQPTGMRPADISEKLEEIIKISTASNRKKKFTVSLRQTIDFSKSANPFYVSSSGVKKFILSGSPDDIIRSVEEYEKNGVDHLLCTFNMREDALMGEINRFAKEIIPSFVR